MSAFGSPWGDIDRTPPGQPYVVDSDGWGWFMLFIILVLPFFMLWLLISKAAAWICMHPIVSGVIYLAVSALISLLMYRGRKIRQRLLGTLAGIITFLPFAAGEALYAIPYVLLQPDKVFGPIFEWIIVTTVLLLFTIFVIAIANASGSVIVHLISAIIFCGVVGLLLRGINSSDVVTWQALGELYVLPA